MTKELNITPKGEEQGPRTIQSIKREFDAFDIKSSFQRPGDGGREEGESRKSNLEDKGNQDLVDPAQAWDLSKGDNGQAYPTLQENKDTLDFEQKLEQFNVDDVKDPFGARGGTSGQELKYRNEELPQEGTQRQGADDLVAL